MLGALLLLGAVTAAGFFAALQEWRVALNAEGSLAAREAALSGIAAALAAGGGPLADAAVGATVRVGAARLTNATYDASVTRLGGDLMAVTGAGRDLRLGIERVAVLPARLVPLVPRGSSTVLLRRAPHPQLAARISGHDVSPAGWLCAPPRGPVPAVALDSVTPDSAFFRLGPLSVAGLRDWAARGMPHDSPAVVVAGDTSLDGGRLAGILAADGRIVVRGGAHVTGTLLATGDIEFGPGGGIITGAILARSITLQSGVPPSEVAIVRSSCAVGLAGRFRAPLAPLSGVRPEDVR
jgi:hypothetical protein